MRICSTLSSSYDATAAVQTAGSPAPTSGLGRLLPAAERSGSASRARSAAAVGILSPPRRPPAPRVASRLQLDCPKPLNATRRAIPGRFLHAVPSPGGLPAIVSAAFTSTPAPPAAAPTRRPGSASVVNRGTTAPCTSTVTGTVPRWHSLSVRRVGLGLIEYASPPRLPAFASR